MTIKKAVDDALKRISCVEGRKPSRGAGPEKTSDGDNAALLVDSAPAAAAEAAAKVSGGHTFTFRIGTIRPTKSNRWVEGPGPMFNLCLPGRVLNFRCSSKHVSRAGSPTHD